MEQKKLFKINQIKPNPNNPRILSDEAFNRLKAKIKRNPDGLTANKIVHKDGIIIAGNQRWRALQELKLELKEDWFKDVSDWTDEQIKEYLIISNISDGTWDWNILANEWNAELLNDWGLDLPRFDEKINDNKEINAEDLLSDDTIICPKCKFEFEKS